MGSGWRRGKAQEHPSPSHLPSRLLFFFSQGTECCSGMKALKMMPAMTSGATWELWMSTPLVGVPSTAKSWCPHGVSWFLGGPRQKGCHLSHVRPEQNPPASSVPEALWWIQAVELSFIGGGHCWLQEAEKVVQSLYQSLGWLWGPLSAGVLAAYNQASACCFHSDPCQVHRLEGLPHEAAGGFQDASGGFPYQGLAVSPLCLLTALLPVPPPIL